jgi:Bifunctional DNA primase/polymerase, N-terminal/Primase C terminal 1 (PriCT-1)/Protein of unknown function (DUF3987)
MTANDIMAIPQAALTTRLAMALAYAQRGWAVFPVFGLQDGACVCKFEHDAQYNGAHPHLGYSYRDATCDYDTIAKWFKQWPHMNFGVATGREIANNKKMLIIIETPAAAVLSEEAVAKVAAVIGVNFSIAGIVLTPQGTRHVYAEICADHDLNISAIKGIKVQAKEGQAWGACSLHHTGAAYQWVGAPLDVPCLSDAVNHAHNGAADDPAVAIDANEAQPAEDENSPAVVVPNDFQATANAVTKRIAANRAIAAEYMAAGFKLCSIATGTKGPKTTGWQDNPITLDQVNHQGLGLIHALSGTCAIDLDNYESAVAWLEIRGIDLRALLADDHAVQIKSGRPNHGKLVYRLPKGIMPLVTAQVKTPDKSMMIEFRCASSNGTGCQDVLPPTIHPETGKAYDWAGAGDFNNLPDLPQELLKVWQDLLAAPSATTTSASVGMSPAYRLVEGGRNTALFKIGGNMARQGLSPESIRAALSIENKKRCTPPLPEAEVTSIANSAAKNSHGAKEAAALAACSGDDEEALQMAEKAVADDDQEVRVLDEGHVSLSQLPLVMRDIAAWNMRTARTVQPAFAICTALAACAGVIARDFVGAGGSYSNMYYVVVGPTACGKENALKTVNKIIGAYDADRLAGKPTSDSSMLTVLNRNPASTFVIDELGEVLQGVFDPKAASHHARVGTALMELYTKGGETYRGTEYAIQEAKPGGRPRNDIVSPCPSLFGATTATTLYKAMSFDAISSGFLPRILPFRAPDKIPMPNVDFEAAPMPESILNWLTAIKERKEVHAGKLKQKGDLFGASNSNHMPIEVPYSPAAHALSVKAQIEIVERRNGDVDEVEGSMLTRTVENASRIALALALADDPAAVEVSAEHFTLALAIVTHAAANFTADIRDKLHGSQYAKIETSAYNQILTYFKKNKKAITERILVDRCKVYGAAAPRDRGQAINALVRQGKITQGTGRTGTVITYLPRG